MATANKKIMHHYSITNAPNSPTLPLIVRVKNVFSVLLGLREIGLHFIREDPNGAIEFDRNIFGYCSINGKAIFIHRDVHLHQQIRTVLHELKHCSQIAMGQQYSVSEATRERDANLFELEYSPPCDPQAIERWLARIERTLVEVVRENYERRIFGN